MAAGNYGNADKWQSDLVVRIRLLQPSSRCSRLHHIRLQTKRSRGIPEEIR